MGGLDHDRGREGAFFSTWSARRPASTSSPVYASAHRTSPPLVTVVRTARQAPSLMAARRIGYVGSRGHADVQICAAVVFHPVSGHA